MAQEKMESRGKWDELRRRAEEILAYRDEERESTDEEMKHLLHELSVHQIELEMQNEELIQARNELEEIKERYWHLYDFAPVGYITIDIQGMIKMANLTFCDMVGQDRSLLSRMRFASLVDDTDRKVLYQIMGGGGKSVEVRIKRLEGDLFWGLLQIAAAMDKSQGVMEWRVTVTDISERKRMEELRTTAEELRRSNRDLEQFALMASHDLREPLRVVTGFLELLERQYGGCMEDQAREYVGLALEGGRQMKRLIENLLAFSRLGKGGLEMGPVRLDDIVEHVLDSLGSAIAEGEATIERDPLPVVWGDPVQMAQLYQNLMSNAIKFRRPGVAPVIQIGSRPEGDRWLLWVRDNGLGIARDHKERIFDLFQRLHSIDEYPGTGIGLAICKRIIEQHWGEIWVESSLGSGSSFLFTLRRG